jgi:5-methylcytosine-specific restriction endonuclease McrBC regulatory subunit McrC
LELENVTVIVDAKYKRHWEELQDGGWRGLADEVREHHRGDLLQILAYANLVSGREIVCCLVYPCTMTTWESLARRGRLFHQSELPNRGRRIRVWLTAMPMSAAAAEVAQLLSQQLRSIQFL